MAATMAHTASSQSLPRIKQLYTTPATPASSPATVQTTFSLPASSWSRHGASRRAAAAASHAAGPSAIPRAAVAPAAKRESSAYTPKEALAKYRRVLTKYEQNEIKQYPSVYYVGPTARKIEPSDSKPHNMGYDDDKARYKCVKNDHIAYRYEVIKGLGKGSFGDVVKAFDHKTNEHVALKIIRNERRFHKQARTEIKLLDMLRRQDKRGSHNVIHMKDYFMFRGHLCITFEIMHCDLYAALKKGGFRGFQLHTIRNYTSSLVTALRVLRRARIIHCDLKPENILLRGPKSDEIKIIDFGSSCSDSEKVHTYIQSRFYRSPEVILGLGYGVPIDMWSLGCILVELYTGQPIFPGHDEKEQLMYQMEVLGVPPPELLRSATRAAEHFGPGGTPLNPNDRKGRRRAPGSRSLAQAVQSNDPAFLDFISRCLCWDPNLRMTPREAAHHEFVTGIPTPVPVAAGASGAAPAAGAGAEPSDLPGSSAATGPQCAQRRVSSTASLIGPGSARSIGRGKRARANSDGISMHHYHRRPPQPVAPCRPRGLSEPQLDVAVAQASQMLAGARGSSGSGSATDVMPGRGNSLGHNHGGDTG